MALDERLRAELDELAVTLGRSVSMDDPEGRLLGYSVQTDDADEARIAAILTRRVPEAVQRWQDERGVRMATEPVRLPANPELGMSERLCVPIRDGDAGLAHLWVLESGRTLSPAEVRATTESAARIRELLRARVGPRNGQRPLDRLLRSLVVAEQSGATEDVAQEMAKIQPELSSAASCFTVFVPASADRDGVRTLSSSATSDLESALAPALRSERAYVASCVQPAMGVVLLRGTPREADRVTKKVERILAGRHEADCFAVGTSEPTQFGTSHFRSGIEEAVAAARCAAADPALPLRVAWSELGVYQLLATARKVEGMHAVLAPLELEGSGPMLLETLETYLDLACDARLTSARLNLHRTSLYYRLGRIAEVLQVDLGDGMTRTHLHLAVKSRRLNGRA